MNRDLNKCLSARVKDIRIDLYMKYYFIKLCYITFKVQANEEGLKLNGLHLFVFSAAVYIYRHCLREECWTKSKRKGR
jgi:hypothetical protein